ncbi:hypothetical protein MmmBen181_1153 [Mycoplasma mycoides subsp. mycoides]|uniref:Chromosome partition protein Smc n=2 Tax=Mycoplasma mycoides TaxID=2102 RepID=Q6MRT6_MYCMS|nr:helix-rich protein [Mycoplasma mycoides]QQY78221.1 helix-rich protein [Mycoplasma mycoides subsp. capri]CAE77632.1 Conserved hypothetical protein [Mycoplasma mycoides subsp. mycoides SC str. PG1]ADK69394.1 conserved hypothetical protein [Mycoplasma mycoides subsp. mycoides SC str. Gladysdale]AIZ55893.1 hypothetical protein mycmycITA_01081 [Mycoplasma mycoides subsp. mycoides]AME11200.1 hypothetical protein MmmBen_1082 [Mycoplasma mycoides subsp. mycoides]
MTILENQKQNKQKNIDDIKHQLWKKNYLLSVLQAKIQKHNELKIKVSDLEKQRSVLLKTLEQNQQEIEQETNVLKNTQKQLKQLSNSNIDALKRLEIKTLELEQAKRKNINLENELKEIKVKILTLKQEKEEQLRIFKKENDELLKQQRDLSEQIVLKNNEISNLTNEIAAKKIVIKDLERSTKYQEEKIRLLSEEYENNKKNLKSQEKDLKEKTEMLLMLNKQKTDLEQTLVMLTKEKDQLLVNEEKLKNEISEISKKISDKKDELIKDDTALKKIKTVINGIDQNLSELKSTNSKLKKSNDQKQELVNKKSKEIVTIIEEIETYGMKVWNVSQKLEETKKEYERLSLIKMNLNSSSKKIYGFLQFIKEEFNKIRVIWPETITKNKELKIIIDQFIEITQKWLDPSELSVHYKKYIDSMTEIKKRADDKYLEISDLYSRLDQCVKDLDNYTKNFNKAVDDALKINNPQPIE